jgi:predicted N-acetyltransferase YhbS
LRRRTERISGISASKGSGKTVEPVCTIPGYRGKGIAAALLSEAFSRAKALGAKKAYVISDFPFYEKLGFQKAQHYSFYRKEK